MRRTKEDAAKTRAAIIDAALDCFDRHGIAGSTLDHIAKAANCTKGAIYHYFDGKASILQERDVPALERIERLLLGILDAVETDMRTRQAITVMQLRCEYVNGLQKE